MRLYLGSFNNQNLPLVSICIPAYNAESTIAETLDTVLAQDYPSLDIVVSDNQSTDNTKAIVQQYLAHGVRYVYHSEGRPDWAAKMPKYIGGFANWNYVLSQGHGDYLCLFHSDDLYEPSIVREQISVMRENPQVGAVFTQARRIDEDSRPIRMGITKFPKELKGQWKFDFPSLLNAICAYGNFFFTPSVMLRRSVMNEVGGFNERRFLTSADLDMWLRIAREGYQIAVIDEPLLRYRISQKQFGSQYNKLRTSLADYFMVVEQYLRQPDVNKLVKAPAFSVYKMHRAADQIGCAINFFVKGQAGEAKTNLLQALKCAYIMAAFKRPRYLALFGAGCILLYSSYLGLGTFSGQQIYKLFQRYSKRQREPIKISHSEII